MEKYKIEKGLVQEIPIRFLVTSVSRWQKLADGPMHLQIVRIDFCGIHSRLDWRRLCRLNYGKDC